MEYATFEGSVFMYKEIMELKFLYAIVFTLEKREPQIFILKCNFVGQNTIWSRAVDQAIIQFWTFLSKGIKFPLHKQSENS